MNLTKFNVAKVETNKESIKFSQAKEVGWFVLKELNGKEIEYIPEFPKNFQLTKTNSLATLIDVCFYKHYPLLLTPDCIWLAIIQGFGIHVNENAEKLRKKFVDFEGKKEITIIREDFIKGSDKNDWDGVFPQFEEKISNYLGKDLTNLITNKFSTSSKIDEISFKISLMETFQKYFDYKMMGGCGIPSIAISGTLEDWKKLRERAEKLLSIDEDLQFWKNSLLFILDEFISAVNGKANINFWNSISMRNGMSGSKTASNGRMNVFFPYVRNEYEKKLVKNDVKVDWLKLVTTENINHEENIEFDSEIESSFIPKLDSYPKSIREAPFVYIDLADNGKKYDMGFVSGNFGIVQNNDGFLSSFISYCVIQK